MLFQSLVRMVILLLLLLLQVVCGLENGLARTPPMGWMSWQRFRCITDCVTYPDECISEQLFRNMSDLMASDGYLAAGYEYIIIDDCWMSRDRDINGRLQPDPDRFPSGIKALADYVHSRGLKFGIYEDYGNFTCAGYPGILGHLEIDAQTFAEWEVDYIKLDGCYSDIADMEIGYADFGNFLNATGRPIVYSCSWPAYMEPIGIKPNYDVLAETCNLWRNWDDIDDAWNNVTNILGWFSTNQDRIANYSGPGHWNDPDMLLIGNYGLSEEQSKAQMAVWAVLAAPLLMSVDLRTIKAEHKNILLNRDVIAINQDPLGIQGLRITAINRTEIWTKPITPIVNGCYSYAVAFLSYRVDGYAHKMDIPLSTVGLNCSTSYKVQDVYNPGVPIAINSNDSFEVRVKPSGVVLLRVEPLQANEDDEATAEML